MPTPNRKLIAAIITATSGAYALSKNRSTLPLYAPRMPDYMNAGSVVAGGILNPPQNSLSGWRHANREMLNASNPRPEVAGVNRALEENNVDLRDEELALFLTQQRLVRNPFDPGADLAAELLISHSFRVEKDELMVEAKEVTEHADIEEPLAGDIRRQAAAAKVGEMAHLTYGALKSTFSYGAITEDDLGAGCYNEAAINEHRAEVEAMAKEEQESLPAQFAAASINKTKTMRETLHEMRVEPQEEPEDKPSPHP